MRWTSDAVIFAQVPRLFTNLFWILQGADFKWFW